MYDPVPPVTVTVAEPLLPLQVEPVLVTEGASAGGSVMVTVCVCTQLPASVTVQVYVPAVRPVAVAAVPPEGVQLYVYGDVPPEAATVAVPVAPPKQLTSVCAESETSGAPKLFMVTLMLSTQPLASVMMQV